MAATFDFSIVGGGLIGLATAYGLLESRQGRVVVLEASQRLASHQSGRNSGVIHSGLYYEPGSLKARLCRSGRASLLSFCSEHGVAHRMTGKLLVATDDSELPRLERLKERGIANGLQGIERVDPAAIRELEPEASGVGGLWVPEAGVVDFSSVARSLASRVMELGGEVRLGSVVRRISASTSGVDVFTAGDRFSCAKMINCAGLQADRVARLSGLAPSVRIIPFRGDYHRLRDERAHLVRGLIYPVPDPRLPFLGVHLTRRIDGSVEAGPNALLSLAREGYSRTAFSLRDASATLAFPGFWRLASRHWRSGLAEVGRSLSKRRLARDVARLVPAVRRSDLVAAGCGIRAQAVDRQGRLLDDFVFEQDDSGLHVLNAPSPGATSCLAIGRHLAACIAG